MRQLLLLALLLAPAAAHGQSEAALKGYFEGRTVKLKIAMPGTESGVDEGPRAGGRPQPGRAAEAQESKKANIRQRRLEGGSRFNIRYNDGVPAEALWPEAVRAALAAYVEFPDAAVAVESARPEPPGLPAKGMLLADADRLLGTPEKTSERMEGKLRVLTRTYASSAGRVAAEFVEGVLIRYTVTSE